MGIKYGVKQNVLFDCAASGNSCSIFGTTGNKDDTKGSNPGNCIYLIEFIDESESSNS